MFLHTQGRYLDESNQYRALLKDHPGNGLILNNLAWSLSEGLHQPSEALTYIDEAIQNYGRSAQVLDMRGVILSRLGRHEEAIHDLEEANLSSPSVQTEFHLVVACRAAGRDDLFRKYYERLKTVGLKPDQLDVSERAAYDSIFKH